MRKTGRIGAYECSKCDSKFERFAWDGDPILCECGAEAASTSGGFRPSPEYYSEALGVHPDQIAAAKARFPHHEFAPDGRMRIRSPQDRKRILKEIGYADYA